MLRYTVLLSVFVLSLVFPLGGGMILTQDISPNYSNSCCPLPPPPENPPVTSL